MSSPRVGNPRVGVSASCPVTEKFALLEKIRILCVIYSLSAFFISNVRTPWGDAPNFIPCFSAFIVDEIYFLFVDMLSRFEVKLFQDGGLARFEVPAKLLGIFKHCAQRNSIPLNLRDRRL